MGNIRQISVFLENRAGALSQITNLLADSGINLRALSIADSADYGVLRILADDTDRAVEALEKVGCAYSVTPVSVVAVKDEPAGLSRVLHLLAEEGVDIAYLYSLFTHRDGKAYMVFRLKDEKGFRQVIEEHHMTLATPEELELK